MRYNLNRGYLAPNSTDEMKASKYFQRERKKGLRISKFQEEQIKQLFGFFRLNGESFMKTQSCFIKAKKMIEAGVETFFVQRLIHSQTYGLATSNPVRHMVLYGLVGLINYEKYVSFQSEKNKFEYKKKHHGMTEEEFKEFNLSRAVTLENCVERHGVEEGARIFNEYCEIQKDSGVSLEWFQKVHGKEEGERVFNRVNEQKGRSVSSFMKYKGLPFKEAVDAAEMSTRRMHRTSDMADGFFMELESHLPAHITDLSFTAFKNYEFGLYDPSADRITRFDYAIPELKFIIEFNGDFWHMNPEIYTPCQLRRIGGIPYATAGQIWELDSSKNKIATDAGYAVYVIWERDYNTSKESIIAKYVEVINEAFRTYRV